MSYLTLSLNNLKNKKFTNAKLLEFAMYMEVIIYLLLYHLYHCNFEEINFRGFHGFLAIPRELIYLIFFSEVLFRAASVLQSIIIFL